MRAIFRVVLLVGTGLAACADLGPAGPRRASLSRFDVPATAAQTDTIRISFTYWLGCRETIQAIEVKPAYDSLGVTVWARDGDAACAWENEIFLRPFVSTYVALPPRAATYSVIFHGSGGDSVRVVTAR